MLHGKRKGGQTRILREHQEGNNTAFKDQIPHNRFKKKKNPPKLAQTCASSGETRRAQELAISIRDTKPYMCIHVLLSRL